MHCCAVKLHAAKTANIVLTLQTAQSFPWQHLVAGAAGGAISRSATAPLELLRLQAMTGGAPVQVHSTGGAAVLTARRKPNLLEALKAAAGDRGWAGLWRGNGLNVLRAGPQKAIDFFSFELYKVHHSAFFSFELCKVQHSATTVSMATLVPNIHCN